MIKDKARLELSAKGKSTKLKKKIEEDIVFNNLSLYHSEDIVELDVIENFDNGKEKPVVSKKKLTIEDFVSFCTGSRYITHNLMRAGTIDFRHFA